MSTWGAPEDGADRNADRSTDEGIISFLVASTRGSRYSASRKVLGARLSGSFGFGGGAAAFALGMAIHNEALARNTQSAPEPDLLVRDGR
jgi:hypothetical protein